MNDTGEAMVLSTMGVSEEEQQWVRDRNLAKNRLCEDYLRPAIVAEARTWLRTPYRHCGATRGVAVDCGMLLVCVYKALHLIPEDMDPRPYSPDWFLHRDEEVYRGWLSVHCRKVEHALPGDIAAYRFGRTLSHAAIVVDDDYMIHAHRQSRVVELIERRAMEDRHDSNWSFF